MADNESFMRHWTKAQPTVASYLSALIPDFHEAEDLLQEVAVILLRKFSQYDPNRSFTGWALGIARLEVLARRRSHARNIIKLNNEAIESLTAVYAEMAPELQDREAALRECLKRIGGRALELLTLRYQDAMQPREIAARMQIEARAVCVALCRVRSSLQDCIERGVAAQEVPA